MSIHLLKHTHDDEHLGTYDVMQKYHCFHLLGKPKVVCEHSHHGSSTHRASTLNNFNNKASNFYDDPNKGKELKRAKLETKWCPYWHKISQGSSWRNTSCLSFDWCRSQIHQMFWQIFGTWQGKKIKSLLLTQRTFFDNLLDFEDLFFELPKYRSTLKCFYFPLWRKPHLANSFCRWSPWWLHHKIEYIKTPATSDFFRENLTCFSWKRNILS